MRSSTDHQTQDQPLKKPSVQKWQYGKVKPTHSNHYYSQPNRSKVYHTQSSARDVHGFRQASTTLNTTAKTRSVRFLPRISRASAMSDYSTNSGFTTTTMNTARHGYKVYGWGDEEKNEKAMDNERMLVWKRQFSELNNKSIKEIEVSSTSDRNQSIRLIMIDLFKTWAQWRLFTCSFSRLDNMWSAHARLSFDSHFNHKPLFR
jgi:hypothetical protein